MNLCEIQIKGGDLFFMERMTKLKFIESSCLSNKNKKMIVKIRTKDEGWYYFEVDSVKVRTLTKEQYECGILTNTPDVLEISGLKEHNKAATFEGIKCINCSI